MVECENCGRKYAKLGYAKHKKACDIFYKNDFIDQYKNGKSPNRLSKEYNMSPEKIKEYLGDNIDNRKRRYIDPIVEKNRRNKISKKLKKNPNGGGYRKGSGRGKSGKYKGYWCDSTYELVWVIYHIDHGIKFERNEQKFKYKHKGKSKTYLPDFTKNGILYEVKGYKDDLTDLKLKSVNKPIRILYKEDIQHMFDYVHDKYNTRHLYNLYDTKHENIYYIKEKLDIESKEEYLNLLKKFTYSDICRENKVSRKELAHLTRYYNINIFKLNRTKRKFNKVKNKKDPIVYYCKCGNKVSRKGNRCMKCAKYQERKIKNRPSYNQLLEDINKTNYTKTGEKYGVSDNCIRKWIKKYERENGKL
jgi:hypothetical protein